MRILVVEDQPKMSNFLKRGLQEAGYAVDIAETVLFLASSGAKNIYGQEIVVDGGYTIG